MSVTLIPQIVHTVRVKRVDQLSPLFLFINTTGTVFMIIYSSQETLYPVMITNVIILGSLLVLVGLYIRYYPKRESVSPSETR